MIKIVTPHLNGVGATSVAHRWPRFTGPYPLFPGKVRRCEKINFLAQTGRMVGVEKF